MGERHVGPALGVRTHPRRPRGRWTGAQPARRRRHCGDGAAAEAERRARREGYGAAGRADIVVTNHALLAIDALEGRAVLPEHDVVVVDEAHELVDRVTGVATGEAAGLTASTLAGGAGCAITGAERKRAASAPGTKRSGFRIRWLMAEL